VGVLGVKGGGKKKVVIILTVIIIDVDLFFTYVRV